MNAQVRITVANDDNELATFQFQDPKECYVGKAPDCDIRLPLVAGQKDVSQHHCIFHVDPPAVWLQILDPRNRTRVNDLAISSTTDDPLIELRDGDEVCVGPYKLEVQVAMDDPFDVIVAGHAASEWNA